MDGSAPQGARKTWAYGASLQFDKGDARQGLQYQGINGYTGFGGSYLPYNAPRYPIAGIDHLPKGRDFNTWGAMGYANTPSKVDKDAFNGSNDPKFSHKWITVR
ncbi:hypothetical protein OEZ85_014205 [Tetradesmus obliquus]|uniref:Uncharacterized protein n=1 Tax=Tetradesmus obliquus TaxID=3088 RepID=A0ABY8UAC5_TETOB|nr:hypothetical protein OEZ85_014205 [Tetradesmus obliquus]